MFWLVSSIIRVDWSRLALEFFCVASFPFSSFFVFVLLLLLTFLLVLVFLLIIIVIVFIVLGGFIALLLF